ncbi:BlaB/IND/MUS family subclass B1 metallo-beta-lactamase [Elizabethkingia sp. JS20170427COW]|uniref:BlaB/IND/MUS family subclass B1 metallo-beta-lactamase n=1 Tax=Elizabethkingia sp. JS20170427COW TaxID=2583851 RepID=UPI0011104B14|nr:BlaB/IND/MUS family subclass B1 metallo-beta-lactamase [Elizabethkingia sp. JS20170427COW]QCX53705.1 BlaB/IND/MUS family subclass B1 metallo-beta-lactamase [Elizabethkingia sp. JS20170427COW]
MKNILTIFLIALGASFQLYTAQEVKKFTIEKALSPHLYLYKSYGVFGGREYSANALYLITKKGVVLFDVPWQRNQYQELLDEIYQKHQLPVIAVFATHWHQDRAGDLSFFNRKNIPTYATEKTNRLLLQNGKSPSSHLIQLGKTYTIGGEKFRIDFPGEGHTEDNVVVWFPKYHILDGGCLVKSSEATDLGNLEEINTQQWPASIQYIYQHYPKNIMVIPGHDEWEKGDHLQHTLDLLNAYHSKN